jgi:hypothetical protein
VLANREAVAGDHTDTLVALSNLARILKLQGNKAGAETQYRAALTRHRKVLGDTHKDTLTAVNSLAVHLHEIGMFAYYVFNITFKHVINNNITANIN